MDKVELAKMIGLTLDSYMSVQKYDIVDCIEYDWGNIVWSFCDEKIIVRLYSTIKLSIL